MQAECNAAASQHCTPRTAHALICLLSLTDALCRAMQCCKSTPEVALRCCTLRIAHA